MGKRQGHSPGEGEAGTGVSAPLLSWEQSQQGCWLGPRSTGGAGKVRPPEPSLAQILPALLPSLPSSPAQALTCSHSQLPR